MRLRNVPRADEMIAEHKNVIQREQEYKGRWNDVFANDNPTHIEIGMGKGQFILNLAKQNPHINYIGIERYSSVLFRATERMDTDEFASLTNIKLICMDATQIEEVFAQGEVARIYLNFSDPWPKARHARRRLTSKQFFKRYEGVLAKQGQVEFKTDNRGLFDFSVEEVKEAGWNMLECTYDLHADVKMNQNNVMTEYEEKFSSMGNPIHKLIAGREPFHSPVI